mmetsp:Transcript_108068/g.279480  ORF Transcript_108068/g.279480 Transcript_108068/m.279480 type:complete len:236 (+) Transcript_108068:84-791(+)
MFHLGSARALTPTLLECGRPRAQTPGCVLVVALTLHLAGLAWGLAMGLQVEARRGSGPGSAKRRRPTGNRTATCGSGARAHATTTRRRRRRPSHTSELWSRWRQPYAETSSETAGGATTIEARRGNRVIVCQAVLEQKVTLWPSATQGLQRAPRRERGVAQSRVILQPQPSAARARTQVLQPPRCSQAACSCAQFRQSAPTGSSRLLSRCGTCTSSISLDQRGVLWTSWRWQRSW